jgi:potassium/hydrogen antiporter
MPTSSSSAGRCSQRLSRRRCSPRACGCPRSSCSSASAWRSALTAWAGSRWTTTRSRARWGRSAASGVALVATFAAAAIAYGAAGSLEGSGFLAVYVTGLMLADAQLPERPVVLAFHQGLAAVAEMGMFLTLGLLVFPHRLGGVLVRGTVLALLVAFAARSFGAWAATLGSRLSGRERALVGWAGLRGGVPVVLATLPVIAGVRGSVGFFDLVFFAVLVSTVLQGTTVEPLARRLGLAGAQAADAQ